MQFKLPDDTSSINVRSVKFLYFVSVLPALVCQRRAWLDWFTAKSRPTISVPDELREQPIIQVNCEDDNWSELIPFNDWAVVHVPNKSYKGDKVFDTEDTEPTSEFSTYGVLVPEDKAKFVLLFKLNDDADLAPFEMGDVFVLTKGMIPNYTGEDTYTDIGKYFFNYLLLVDPFEGKPQIPYINKRLVPGEVDAKMTELIINNKANRKIYNKYMVNAYTFCEDGSIATATWSKKSLTIDPVVLKRKEELFKKYADSLDNPVVMVAIEKELVDLDKATIKGDEAEPFMFTDPGKTFGEQRRKFFIQFGVTAAFSKFGGTEYMKNSLSEGMRIEDIPIGANEIRRGAYGRGKETAKGGEQTKFLLRIFQNVKITEDDCDSKRGLKVHVTENNYKQWVGRYPVRGGRPYTLETLKAAIDTDIIIRSPMYCSTPDGYCKKCCGEFFEKVDISAIGMQGLSITSGITSASMKTMHASSMKGFTLKDFNRFLRK